MSIKKTIVIGTGVVNLISAYFLAKQENQALVLIDKAPSPFSLANWQNYGCTFSGENVRMYTYTEADNYNEKGNQLYSKMDEVFEQTINNNGWLIKAKNTLNQQEREWMQDFHKVTPEEAIQFGEDIYTVNIESGKIWKKWMRDAPELFDDLDLVKDL